MCCFQVTHSKYNHTDMLKVEGLEKYTTNILIKNKTRVAILLSEKGDQIRKSYWTQTVTLHKEKMINPPRRRNNLKCVRAKQSLEIHEANTDRPESINKPIQICICRLLQPTLRK